MIELTLLKAGIKNIAGVVEKNKETEIVKLNNKIFLNFLACILTEYIFFLNNNNRGCYK